MIYLNLRSCSFKNIHMCAEITDSEALVRDDMESWFAFNMSYNEDYSTAMAVLSQEIRSKTEPEKLNISLDVVGLFSCEGIHSVDDQKQVHMQAYQLLFGHVQSAAATLTMLAGLPPMMIAVGRMNPEDIQFQSSPGAVEEEENK